MSVEVGTAYVTIIPSAKGFAGKLQSEIGGDLDKAGEASGKSFGGKLMGGIGIAAGLAGAAVVGGLGIALTKGFGRLTAIENATAKLTGLGNSADSVKVIMDNALASVKGTAFGMDEAATTAAGAVAAGVKPGKELERTLKLVGDAATIGGSSMSEMGSIFNKVATSGKLQGDVLNQLSDQGIPIVALLGKTLGKTGAEVVAMASAGKINFAMFQDAMEAGMGGAALKSGETTQGAFKNMGAAVSRFGATLLTGVFPVAKQVFGGITTAVDALGARVAPLAEKFSGILATAFVNIKEAASVFFDALQSDAWVIPLMNAGLKINGLFNSAKYAASIFFDALRGYESDTDTWVLPLMAAGLRIYALFEQLKLAALQFYAGLRTDPAVIGAPLEGLVAVGARVREAFETVKGAFMLVCEFVQANLRPIFESLGFTMGGVLVKVATTLAIVLGGALFGAIAAVVTAIGPVTLLLGTLAGALFNAYQNSATFRDVVAQVGVFIMTQALPALQRLGAWIMSNVVPAVMAIVTAIQGFVAVALPIVVQFVTGMMARIQPLMPQIQGIFTTIGQIIVSALQLIAAVIERVTAVISFVWRNWGQNIMDFIAVVFRTVLGVIRPALDLIMSIVRTFIAVFHGDWSGAWEGVKSILSNAWAVIKAIIGGALDVIKGALALAWAVILTAVKAVWQRVLDSINETWGAITQRIGFGVENAKKTLSDAWDSIRRTVGAAWDAVVGLVSDAWERLKTGVGRGIDTLKKWLSDAWESIKGAASGAWGGIVSAVGSVWDGIIAKIKAPLQTVLKFIGDNFIKPLNDMLSKVGIDFRIPWPSLADGGPVGPGLVNYGAKPRGYDVGGTVLGWSPHERADNIPAMLTADEEVIRQRSARNMRRQHPGALEWINEFGTLPGHAGGGLVRGYADGGSVWDAIKTGARVGAGLTPVGSAVNAVGDVGSFLADPVGKFKELVARLLSGIGSGVFPEIAKGALTKFGDGLAEKAKSMLAAVTGGGGGGSVGTAVNLGGGQVSIGGRLLDATTASIFQRASAALGGLNLMQGSWSTSVGASGGTHAGSGAMDVWPANGDWRRAVDVVRSLGGIAWHRVPSQGPWAEHIHSITPGIPGLSASAQAQVGNFRAGLNGLVGGGPDNNGYWGGGLVKPILLDSGGVIPRGVSMVENNTGAPEHLTRTGGASVTNHFSIPSMDPYAVALEVSRRQLMGV